MLVQVNAGMCVWTIFWPGEARNQWSLFQNEYQCMCGPGMWIRIRIHFPFWIRIRIYYPHSDIGRKNIMKKQEMQGNRWLAFYYGTCFTVNLDQLQFFVSFFISRKLFIKFFSQICLAWIRIRIKKAAGSRSALRKTARSGSAKNECGWDQQLWCGQYYDPSRPGTMMVSIPEA